MHASFEERKVPQTLSGNFAQNGSSVRHMFCTIFVPLSAAKAHEKHVRSSSFLVLFLFFKENSHSHSIVNLLNGYFYYSYFTPNFSNRYFPNS